MTDRISPVGFEKLRKGRRALGQARYLLATTSSAESEAKALQSLALLRSAMDWLEDTEYFETAHKELDVAGHFVRTTFGCHLTFDDGTYYVDCPVRLAHNRVGMSIGAIVKQAECSICGEDPEDCPHIKGRVYDGTVCVRRLCEMEVLEVSLVGRPAQPDARFMRMSVPNSALREALGSEWRPGVPVNCDFCLMDCGGVSDPFGGH